MPPLGQSYFYVMSAPKAYFKWNAQETAVVESYLDKLGNKQVKIGDMVTAVAELLRKAATKDKKIRNIPLKKIQDKLSNTVKARERAEASLEEFLAEEDGDQDAGEEDEDEQLVNKRPTRANRKRVRHQDEDEAENVNDSIEEEAAPPVKRPTPASSASTAPSAQPSSKKIKPTVDIDSNKDAGAAATSKALPKQPVSLSQPAYSFKQTSRSQTLDPHTLRWIIEVENVLPPNILQFVQMRRRLDRISLALAAPPGYSVSALTNADGFVALTFTKQDYTPLLYQWATYLDTLQEEGLKPDVQRGAFPAVTAPSIPLTIFLPLHPEQNSDADTHFKPPTDSLPLATLIIPLLPTGQP